MGGWGSSTSSSTTHGMLVGSLLPSFLLSCFPRPLVRPLDDPDLYTAIGNLSLHFYPCSFCRRLVGLRHRADRTQPVFVGAGGLRRRRARAAPSSTLAPFDVRVTHRPNLRVAAPLEGLGSNPAVEDHPRGSGQRCRACVCGACAFFASRCACFCVSAACSRVRPRVHFATRSAIFRISCRVFRSVCLVHMLYILIMGARGAPRAAKLVLLLRVNTLESRF